MKDNNTLACFGLVFVAVISVVVSAVMTGWVLSVLWGWFIVPVFSVPHLSVGTAIGLSLVVDILVRQRKSSSEKKELSDIIIEAVSYAILSPLLVLFIGWIVKLFI